MQKSFLVLLVILSFSASAQYNGRNNGHRKMGRGEAACSKAYIGFSTGINNPAGLLGLNIDVPVTAHFDLNAGVGIGTWGNKIYGEARYFLRPCHLGWAFGAGVTYATGLNNFTTNLETTAGDKEQVTLDLYSRTNVYLAAYRFWQLGRRANRIYLELGVSVPVSAGDAYQQTAGNTIDDNSKNTMKVLTPGGLMAGVGFMFGIH